MNYLTPTTLRELAPATQKLPKSDESLIDTSAFLRHVAQQGYKPIYAAQGKAHADVDSPEKGRHLVVVADDEGKTYAILNSHTVYRRAWLGAGYVSGDYFIIGAVVPLPRWRGFAEPLAELVSYQPGLETAITALQEWEPTATQLRWLAKKFASTAYLTGHKPASTNALMPDSAEGLTGYGSLFYMMKEVMNGGLEPDPNFLRGKTRIVLRKVKPLKGPDALMHAANAGFRAGLDAIRKYRLIDTPLNFPSYKRT